MNRGRKPSRRAPFDPGRVKPPPVEPSLFAPADPSAPDGPTLPPMITVSQLTRMVKCALSKELPSTLLVLGEISNLSQPGGGHVYFTLKDSSSEIRCVMWRSSASNLKFTPSDGMEVIATGAIDVYEPRGQYQLYVRKLEPRGVGSLELAFQQLKERLQKEGLFDQKRKRPLPPYIRRVALVTSPTGAAVTDMLQTISRRFPKIEVFVYGVRVQGDGAAREIADAIRRINAVHTDLGGIDVMIVGRGGGSLEDLWAFNEEAVARAIFSSAIPVVSAVGHEIDFTIADFVADIRAATPTAAGELIVPVLDDVLTALDERARVLARLMRCYLDAGRSRLQLSARSDWFRDPLSRVVHRSQEIDEIAGRLKLAASQLLTRDRTRIHDLEVRLTYQRPEAVLSKRRERLAAVQYRMDRAQVEYLRRLERALSKIASRFHCESPRHLLKSFQIGLAGLEKRLRAGSHESILHRGFTITRHHNGRIIREAADVRAGDVINTQTADGAFDSRVDKNQANP